MIGKTLAHYDITDKLGEGGMGEVYKATDTRLGRPVALKVLARHLGQTEDVRQRMEREGRVISNLNHTHICTLYDVGHADGVDFLAMEYLEGQTLAERLAEGPMPLDELLEVAMQVTDALGAAHRQGVIHRDLKPGNIMLTPSGAKLLDFGLAKDLVSQPTSNLTASPTLASPLTSQGMLLGTFHYMAPELLEGAEATPRSDLFALGTVLHEMATGQKAFEGKTQAGLIAALLEREPPSLAAIQPGLPPALEHLVSACLNKDPEQRIQTAHDVLLQLRWISEGKGGTMASPIASSGSSRAGWIVAAVLALACAFFAWRWSSVPGPVPQSVVRADILLPTNVVPMTWGGGHVAISPDGKKVVFSAFDAGDQPQLWIRYLDTSECEPLAGTEIGVYPFWSPDSRHVGFFASGMLRRVQVAGGGSLAICSAGAGRGGTWNEDGVILFAPETTSGLLRVSAGGGEPMAVTEVDSTLEESHRWPVFLPDGNRFLHMVDLHDGPSMVTLASLDGSPAEELLRADTSVAYANDHLLLVRENTLLAQPFDWKTGALAVEPWTVAEPVVRSSSYVRAAFSASAEGKIVFLSSEGDFTSSLATYDRDGKTLNTYDAPTPLDDIDVSDDGTRVAFSRPGEESGQDVWTFDLARQVFSRISLSGFADDPTWSPDGRRIAYADGGDLTVKLASGAGTGEVVLEDNRDKVTSDWSASAGVLIYTTFNGENEEDIWVYHLDGDPGDQPILEGEHRQMHGQLSTDGKWLAYTSTESGRPEVYVLSYPSLEQKWPISRDGGAMPRWRADGGEIYFMSAQKTIVAAPITYTDEGLEIGELTTLMTTRLQSTYRNRTHQYDVSPDGTQFFVIESPAAQSEKTPYLSFVMNWPALGPEGGP